MTVALKRSLRRTIFLLVSLSTLASILVGITRQKSLTFTADLWSGDRQSWAEQLLRSWEESAIQGAPTNPGFARDQPLLLILFTSFDERTTKPYHLLAHRLAVRNWAHFISMGVRPVLFIGGDGRGAGNGKACVERSATLPANMSVLERAARDAGWDVLPQTELNYQGTPKLKPMFRCVFERYPNRCCTILYLEHYSSRSIKFCSIKKSLKFAHFVSLHYVCYWLCYPGFDITMAGGLYPNECDQLDVEGYRSVKTCNAKSHHCIACGRWEKSLPMHDRPPHLEQITLNRREEED